MKNLIKLIKGVIFTLILLITNNVLAEVELQKLVKVTLSVPEVIELEIGEESVQIIPGPEDYMVDIIVLNDPNNPGGGIAYFTNGFAARADAINLFVFTNARKGAKLFVFGTPIPSQEGSLQVSDIFLTVMSEKTYVLFNKLDEVPYVSWTPTHPWPYAATGITPGIDDDAALWLQLTTEALPIFEFEKATKSKRLIVFKVGIGSLSFYTQGKYEGMTTFIFIPTVV